MTAAKSESRRQSAFAASKSARETALKISSESVLVRSEMLPPSIIVMPTSPETRAQPRRTYVNARKALEAAEKERRRETRPHERERDPEEDVAPARAVDAGGLLEFDEARRGERRLKRTHDER